MGHVVGVRVLERVERLPGVVERGFDRQADPFHNCFSGSPSTSSITMTRSSPAQKALCTEAMLGWLRLAWIWISRRKR